MTDQEQSPVNLLELHNVSKRIGRQMIIHPLDLTLERGEVVALCGGNGAGKSTILRMIAGISEPTSGTISVGGVSWKQNRYAYAEQIGYMPDDFNFGLALTAQETIRFYASLRGLPSARVDEVLELVGLHEVRDRKVSTFSKGMRQRLLFAQSLLARPALLVLDEPTNGLDPYWMASFVELIRRLQAEGQSVIFSTHHLEVAEEAADHAVFMNAGRVAQEGAVTGFRDKYGTVGLHGAFTAMAQQGKERKPDEA